MNNRNRPLVTFALFAYNQETYVREAIQAALAQDYSPLEIILSDDCSRDQTFDIMQAAAAEYDGPHALKTRRSSCNRGLAVHLQEALSEATGQLIVLAAGDDASSPERTKKLVNAWMHHGCPPAVICSDFMPIDENSNPVDLGAEGAYKGRHDILSMARGQVRVLGATSAITPDLVSSFPPVSRNVIHEDRVLPFRALLLGGQLIFVDEILVRYRAIGGVSRFKINNLREYLEVYTPAIAQRTLADAIQRLSDTLFRQPGNVRIRRECEATIADDKSRLDLHVCGRRRYELVVLRWLFRGARVVPLLKHYAKLRIVSIFG